MNSKDCCQIYHRFTPDDDRRALREANEPFKEPSAFLLWPFLFVDAILLTVWLLTN